MPSIDVADALVDERRELSERVTNIAQCVNAPAADAVPVETRFYSGSKLQKVEGRCP
jgi:hypothetical protein